MFDAIVDEYFETRPEFLAEINDFERRHNLSLWKKLNRERNEINFFSWLSEVRFGLFFDKICDDLQNDYVIGRKKPDWLINMNGQKILAEVVRLNAPEDEEKNSIKMSRQLRQFQKENPEVPIVVQGGAKVVSFEFLGGNQSKLQQKEEKYRGIITENKLPFILCVATSLRTYLCQSMFFHFLMGSRGFYKSDENFGRNVTGVLLNTYFNEFFYYQNEGALFQLSKRNIDTLLPLFCNNAY
jgi:hypothetical protein